MRQLLLILFVLLVACSSSPELVDTLPLDNERPTLVMFYTKP